MPLKDSLRRLYRLANRGMRPGLGAMHEACTQEQLPQDSFRSIHVAGTNGKGSVCASIESIAYAAGLKTGLYTSPHLCEFAERIRINKKPIDDQTLENELNYVLEKYPTLTFFEVATLVAFRIFRQAQVDLAIIEVGLGGRLDATNVIMKPCATAITTIGFDHMNLLGDSLASIAYEKAGILKSNVPVVIGALPDEALQVVHNQARQVGVSKLWRIGQEIQYKRDKNVLHVEGPNHRLISINPTLHGLHQDHNAAIAIAVAWLLHEQNVFSMIHDATFQEGLSLVDWPGRLEKINIEHGEFKGTYLLDGAHNEDGAYALAQALSLHEENSSQRALIFGTMADKNWRSMLTMLMPFFGTRVYIEPHVQGGGRSACNATEMIEFDSQAILASTITEAIDKAHTQVGTSGLVVIAGSLYLVGEARALLLNKEYNTHVGL